MNRNNTEEQYEQNNRRKSSNNGIIAIIIIGIAFMFFNGDRFDNFKEQAAVFFAAVTAPTPVQGYWGSADSTENSASVMDKTYAISIHAVVPDENQEVYICGNQETLGNWDRHLKMERISTFERAIKINTHFPIEFKFTQGNWDKEGLLTINNLPQGGTIEEVPAWEPNISLAPEDNGLYRFNIGSWKKN